MNPASTRGHMKGKRFIGLVLNESQAKTLLHIFSTAKYGPVVQRHIYQMQAKVAKALHKLSMNNRSEK